MQENMSIFSNESVQQRTLLEKLIRENAGSKDIMIHYHIRPDGDCIGCAYAAAFFLKGLGYRVNIAGHDPVPEVFGYLIKDFTPDEVDEQNLIRIAVDTASPERLGRFADEKIDICIDHHLGNSIDAGIKIAEPQAPACAEILFFLMKEHLAENPYRRQITDLLYMAIITDTERFSHEDVRAQTFIAAAELIKLGADSFRITQRHSVIKSKAELEYEHRLASGYRFLKGHQIVSAVLTQKDALEIGVGINAFPDLSSKPLELETVKAAILVRELEDGYSRVSVRTRGNVDAEEICHKFGGGGHKNAAGCTLREPPGRVRELFETETLDHI